MAEPVRYESSGISRPALFVGAATLLAVLAVSTVVAALLLEWWWPPEDRESASLRVFADSKLDPALARSRARREARWAEQANAYAWIDREAGIARIPVERAITLTLARSQTDEEHRP